MQFKYEAFNKSGQSLKGELDADSELLAVKKLNLQHLSVVSIAQAQENAASGVRKKASTQEIVLAFHELATLLESGVSIADAIHSQSKASYPGDLDRALKFIANNLRKGSSFSESIDQSNLNIPSYMLQLIMAGELSGNLAVSLREGVSQMEYDHKMAKEFKSALIYPLILVFSGIGAVLLIFIFVVPKFASLVARNDDLPFLAEVVLTTGIWFNDNFMLLTVALIIAIFSLVAAMRQQQFRQRCFDIMAELPLLRSWIAETDTAKWASVMSALLSSKVDLLMALDLAAKGVRSTERKERLARVIAGIRGGQPLADTLEEVNVLTPTGYNLIRVGETAGRLPEMMRSLAKLYDESGRHRMQSLLTLIEPVAILIIGLVVGTIILGIILAITSVNDIPL